MAEIPVAARATLEKATVRRAHGVSLQRRHLTIDCRIADILTTLEQADGTPPAEASRLSRLSHPAQEEMTPGAVVSIWGSDPTEKDVYQPYFSSKCMNFDGEDMFDTNMPHAVGLMCQRGHKPESPNQDDFFVIARREWFLFGVQDGHGPDGHILSHFVQERLPKGLLGRLAPSCEEEGSEGSKASDWAESCLAAFEGVTHQIFTEKSEQGHTSGSTASVALLSRDRAEGAGGPLRLRCAFIGDSAIVHGRRALGTDSWEVNMLTDIHRPDRAGEQERIQSCGGHVQGSQGPGQPPRLLTDHLDLAMSRAFGDLYARKEGLISVPEIPAEIVLDESEEHIILMCSDGIWDVIAPQQAVQLVAKFAVTETQKAVEKLVAKAQHRWQESMEEGVVDDITVVLVRPRFTLAESE